MTVDKIKDVNELGSILERAKDAGKKIVYWHGTFDRLDVGQIRQLEAARALGDVLVVTVVGDRCLDVEAQRPQLSETLRAETIAALQMVDYVGIGPAASGASMIRLLKPDVYVRDSDGSEPAADNGHGVEREAAQSVGATLRLASDLGGRVSSAGARVWSPLPDEVAVWIEEFRQRHHAAEVLAALERLKTLRVLIVGEAILDEYVYCDALGKSSKEPILALRYIEQDLHAGGSIAIANHLAEFCRSAHLLAYLGAVNPREEFIRSCIKSNVTPSFISKADSPTIVKRRFVEKTRVVKLLEIYEINDEPLSATEEQALCSRLEQLLPESDVVIVADFGHGLIPPRAARLLAERAPYLAVNTQINAANVGFHTISKYQRADYICMNEGEMRLDARTRRADLRELVSGVADRLGASTIMVTRGLTGTLLYSRKEGFSSCPAFAMKVIDRLGAGDAVLAITSMCAATGMSADVIGFVGNLVGAQAVRIVGNSRSIDRRELFQNIESVLG